MFGLGWLLSTQTVLIVILPVSIVADDVKVVVVMMIVACFLLEKLLEVLLAIHKFSNNGIFNHRVAVLLHTITILLTHIVLRMMNVL